MALPGTELHMTLAIAELAAAGTADPTARRIAVRAVDVVTRPAVSDGSGASARQFVTSQGSSTLMTDLS